VDPSAFVMKAYEALYKTGPNASNIEALEAHLRDSRKESRRQKQKHNVIFLDCVTMIHVDLLGRSPLQKCVAFIKLSTYKKVTYKLLYFLFIHSKAPRY
jgi:hypothetical protein